MPDEMCHIELLKQELKDFKEVCRDRWDREDEYLLEFKKNLHNVSESLQKVIDTQNGQIKFIAGAVGAATFIFGSAWALFSYFFSK